MLSLSFGKFVFKIFSPTFFFFLGFHALTASVFTDTDGDGMTDVAERKYGFDPEDAKSFPDNLFSQGYPSKDTNKSGNVVKFYFKNGGIDKKLEKIM